MKSYNNKIIIIIIVITIIIIIQIISWELRNGLSKLREGQGENNLKNWSLT